MRSWTAGVLLLFACLACVALNIDKAVHVDDPLFLGVAEKILQNPLDPYAGASVYGYGSARTENDNPPLWSYVYAAVWWATGTRDPLPLHVVQAIAFGLLALGTYRLAARATERPLLWTLAVVVSPAVVPGINLMLDVPQWAFAMWALEMQFQACDAEASPRRRFRAGLIAGLLAGAALLTKYTAGLLLPVMAYAALRHRRPAALLSLAPAVLLLAAWCLHNLAYYGKPHLGGGQPMGEVGLPEAMFRLMLIERNLGAVTALTALWCLATAMRGRFHPVAVMVCAGLAFINGFVDQSQSTHRLEISGFAVTTLNAGHFLLFTANGILGLGCCFWLAAVRADPRSAVVDPAPRAAVRDVLAVWAFVGLVFNLFVVPPGPFGAVRHLTAVSIPLTLAAAASVDAVLSRSRFTQAVAVATFTGQFLLTAMLTVADYNAAGAYRTVAADYLAPAVARRPGGVWFIGDPTFRYYADAVGARHWRPGAKNADGSPAPAPLPDDIVFLPDLQGFGVRSHDELKRRTNRVVGQWMLFSPNPPRTLSFGANFYGGSATALPWQLIIDEPKKPGDLWSVPSYDGGVVIQMK
ncbi:MAG: glycosyltransferase family 39 protein [Planctomycetia bacterium]